MESVLQDLRFAVRSFARQPAFALIAIATLAPGIGANTAIVTVVNAVVLQRLPFPDEDRLVRVTADVTGLKAADVGMSPPELFDYRDHADVDRHRDPRDAAAGTARRARGSDDCAARGLNRDKPQAIERQATGRSPIRRLADWRIGGLAMRDSRIRR
jgi:hypothetical protein